MYKTSLALLGLAALSKAQQSGNVSVVLTTTQFNGVNNNIASENKEQIDFAYLVGEWDDNYNVTADTNWDYSYQGEDTYELNTEEGDQIFVTPKQLGFDIPAILDTVTATNNGENITVADTIGYSVAQTYHGVRDIGNVTAANLTNSTNVNNSVNTAANDAQSFIQSSTQSAIDALNQAQASQSPSELAPFLVLDQQYRDALENLQNSYDQALSNLTSAYTTAKNSASQSLSNFTQNAANQANQTLSSAASQAGQALGSAANQTGQAVDSATNSAQQAASNAQQAITSAPQRAVDSANNAANQAGQAVGSAASRVNDAQNAVQNVTSGLSSSFNNGLNSANGNQ